MELLRPSKNGNKAKQIMDLTQPIRDFDIQNRNHSQTPRRKDDKYYLVPNKVRKWFTKVFIKSMDKVFRRISNKSKIVKNLEFDFERQGPTWISSFDPNNRWVCCLCYKNGPGFTLKIKGILFC